MCFSMSGATTNNSGVSGRNEAATVLTGIDLAVDDDAIDWRDNLCIFQIGLGFASVALGLL